MAYLTSKDPVQEVGAGRLTGTSAVQVFGYTETVDGDWRHIEEGSPYPYPWPVLAAPVTITASAYEDADGRGGAHIVYVAGLDNDFEPQSEEITLGTTSESPTVNNYRRILEARVVDAGQYTGTNEGLLEIECGGGVVAAIPALQGASLAARYTVPAGKVGYLRRIWIHSRTGDPCDFRVMVRAQADDSGDDYEAAAGDTYAAARVIMRFPGVSGRTLDLRPDTALALAALTDVWIEVRKTTDSETTARVSALMDFWIEEAS